MHDKFDPKQAVFTPPEAAKIATDLAVKIQGLQARGFPLPLLAGYFDDLLPGELCIIQAQTSNGKSYFAHFWEREAAKALQEQGRTDEIIVHISTEELIETQMYIHLGREMGQTPGSLANGEIKDWENLFMAAERVGLMPIYRIGASLGRPENMPELHMSNIKAALIALKDGLVTGRREKIAAIFIDYLQAMPIDPEVKKSELDGQRRLQVRQDIYTAREIAAWVECPVVLLAQSKQNLGEAAGPLKIPGPYDIEETSSAAQRADRIISLAMPKQSYPVGKMIDPGNGRLIQVEEDTIFIKIAKQRGGRPAGRVYVGKMLYGANEIEVKK